MRRALLMTMLAVVGLTPLARADETPAKPADEPALQITVDTSEAPELKEYGEKVHQLSMEWYPRIAAKLPDEGFTPPRTVTITFKKDYKGVAAAGGNRITCSVKWFTDHPDDLGAIVHELAHVVQQYRRRRPANADAAGAAAGGGAAPVASVRPPGWLVEGIADHVRFFYYEPEDKRPKPTFERAKYDASYRTSAAFLDWAQNKYDKQLVIKLNTACRKAEYNPELWKKLTGKTVEELGAEWKESLKPAEKKNA